MAKTTATDSVPASAEMLAAHRALGDFETLGMVFGWLDAMLSSIEDTAKKEEGSPGARFIRIRELASCGRYLACDWQNTTENMTDALRDALNAPAEASNG